MKEKKLPVSNPILSAYPELGQTFSIIDYDDPESLAWMFSNFVQIYVHRGRRTTYTESLPLHYTAGHKIPTLYHYCIGKKMIEKKYESLSAFLVESVDAGYYASLILDRYYLSSSFNYHRVHKYHNILIYGYNTEKKVFYGRDNEGPYVDIVYSFKEIESAYEKGYECEDFGNNAAGAVILAERMKNVLYEFNVNYLINELEFYLRSYGSEVCAGYNPVRHYRAQLPRVQIKYFNMGVYDYFREMLRDPESTGGVDLIACYVFYEHKCFMKKRVEYLISQEYLDETTLLREKAEEIEKHAHIFFHAVLKSSRVQTGGEVLKKVKHILDISRLLDQIREEEISFVRGLIDELKRKNAGN